MLHRAIERAGRRTTSPAAQWTTSLSPNQGQEEGGRRARAGAGRRRKHIARSRNRTDLNDSWPRLTASPVPCPPPVRTSLLDLLCYGGSTRGQLDPALLQSGAPLPATLTGPFATAARGPLAAAPFDDLLNPKVATCPGRRWIPAALRFIGTQRRAHRSHGVPGPSGRPSRHRGRRFRLRFNADGRHRVPSRSGAVRS
jgi:hypothetical protein